VPSTPADAAEHIGLATQPLAWFANLEAEGRAVYLQPDTGKTCSISAAAADDAGQRIGQSAEFELAAGALVQDEAEPFAGRGAPRADTVMPCPQGEP
jgi:hypothetical protein